MKLRIVKSCFAGGFSLVIIFILLNVSTLFSQGNIKGKVMGKKDSLPLPGVNVQLKGTVLGAITNKNGEFNIKTTQKEIDLIISIVGYDKKNINYSVGRENIQPLEIYLEESVIPTEAVIVTAGKREQLLTEIPVSVNILEAGALLSRNVLSLDGALRYIPGVNMTEYQVNIRGSSGYSRGVGNRVLLLLDGLPLLSGDTGEMKFDAVSISQIDHVEVVKGSGSTLYGSSALGGVINIITKDPSQDASMDVKLYSGMYDSPTYPEWKWSDKTRFFNGCDINYSQFIGDLGIVISGGVKNNDGYRDGDDSKKKNIFVKTKYNTTPKSFLMLIGSYAVEDRGNYVVWKDVDNALKYDSTITNPGERIFSSKLILSSAYKYIVSNDAYLNLKINYYRTHFEDNIPSVNQNSSADVVNGEIQYFFKPFGEHFFTTGVSGTVNQVTSSIFNNRNNFTFSGYIQDEYSIFENAKITGGLRFDYSQTEGSNREQSLTPKIGISYHPFGGTSFRASIGGGFRSPTIGERYTNTNSGGIYIEPNPDLKPEKSWSYEVGGSHSILGFLSIDGALFWNEYSDLIEPVVNSNSGKVIFQNIDEARIYGYEIDLKYDLLSKLFSGEIGYTYLYPYDKKEESIMKFRSKHLFYINNSINYENFFIGADYRFISKIEKVDELLAKIIKSSNVRVPIHVVDLRAAYTWNNFKLLLNLNNLLNYNYVEVIGNLAPIRNYSLSLIYSL